MCNNCNNCTCNGSRFYHRVITATAGTSLELTTTNSDNINDKDPYYFQANARAISNLPTTPLPVTVLINGTFVPLLDKYGVQILSSAIPRKAFGYYSEETTPHVGLINTPQTVVIQ
jgi:hypothetical protein